MRCKSSALGYKKKWIFIFYNKSVFTGFPKNLLSETQLKEIKRKVFEIKNKRT